MNKNELSVRGSTLPLAPGTGMSERTNRNGKYLGVTLSFIGDKSASALKAEGKAKGLKGTALREYVDASLRGDSGTAAWVRHGVAMEGLRKAGAVPVGLDSNKAGDSFKAAFVIPKDDSVKIAKEAAEAVAAKDAEITALRAELAKALLAK